MSPPRQPRPAGFKEPGKRFVYFARAGNGLVKIGCSRQPEERLSQIGEWVPFKIELVAAIAGTFDLEAALHQMFAAEWSHLEWFHSSPALERLIEDVVAGRPFAITASAAYGERYASLRAKKRLTHKLRRAESARWQTNQWPSLKAKRPAYAQAAVDSFRGSHRPPPTAEIELLLGAYIAILNAETALIREAA